MSITAAAPIIRELKTYGKPSQEARRAKRPLPPRRRAKSKAAGMIGGKKTFTDRYGINRWNLNTLQKEPQRDIFQAAWLAYLVRDYGVSAHWLLTGEGQPLTEDQAAR